MADDPTQDAFNASITGGAVASGAIDDDTMNALMQKRQMDMLSQRARNAARDAQVNPSLQDYALMSHGLQALPPIQNED